MFNLKTIISTQILKKDKKMGEKLPIYGRIICRHQGSVHYYKDQEYKPGL